MTRIEIRSGRIVDPVNRLDRVGSVYVSEGKILSIFDQPADFQADRVIDADGQIVCPGFIDMSARLREPGASHKATIRSESLAATSAGVTTLCIPPDTRPVIDTTAVVELLHDKALQAGYQQLLPIGALTRNLDGSELSSMHALKRAGCIAVSNARRPVSNLLVLRRAMEYAASHDLLLVYQPQDFFLSNNGCAHEGRVATRYGLPGIPETAETIAMAQCLELALQTGCRVHFSQLSCSRSVRMLRQAREKQVNLSADVAIHQLHLTDADMQPFDSAYHVIPPFRSQADKRELRAGIADGTINAICSDHQPHDIDAKLGAFPETEAGVSSLETLLPLLLRLVDDKTLDLQQGIATLTSNPAGILQLDAGTLTPGSAADICIFDPEQSWIINELNWKSTGQNTPFWHQPMKGRVTTTVQAGKIIFSLNRGASDEQ